MPFFVRDNHGGSMDGRLKALHDKALSLPQQPGVYIMKDSAGKVIYVGKAKSLKNRVTTYFGSQNNHTEKVRKMVENVKDFDFIVVQSEFEALLLECSLIKQHKPKYNILLKDDKGYSYIKVTPPPWSKISAVKQKGSDGARYIGPFTGSGYVMNAVEQALRIYKLPSCGKEFPRDIGKSRPCLNYFINLCSAPCAGKVSLNEYEEAVSGALRFIEQGGAATKQELLAQMNEAAENLEFEKAAKLRDRINAIDKIGRSQRVVAQKVKNQDIIAAATAGEITCFAVLRFRDGNITDSEHFFIESDEDMPYARAHFILSYYEIRTDVPPIITLDGEIEDEELLKEWLREKRGGGVRINIPVKGEQKELVEICRKNALEKLSLRIGRQSNEVSVLEELMQIVGLKKLPEYIEAYDISHTAGKNNVGGMVVFRNAKPYKSAYRRFIIKGFEGQDDYRSMAEVLERRIGEYEKHKNSENTFGIKPDIILIDGGVGQVKAVRQVLRNSPFADIPVFGMVKDNRHRTRAMTDDGDEITIDSKRRVFRLITEIQNEVHRFAVEYHHKRNTLASKCLTLMQIEGIGRERATQLLKEFKTIDRISKASIEELASVKGISKALAQKIYYHWR